MAETGTNTQKEYLDYAGLQKYNTLIQTFGQGCANQIKQDIIDGAPAAYDTLKEISEYISTHTTEYEALAALAGEKAAQTDLTAAVNRIADLETSVGNIVAISEAEIVEMFATGSGEASE